MMLDLEPLLRPVTIDDLRPTQMTVGFREVERKRRQWRARVEKDGADYLGRHMIPVVLGPGGEHWMIDNHHLARALHEEGVKDVLVRVIADLSGLKGRLFRTFMDNRNWFHPFDAEGDRRELTKIPRHVKGLTDDPYRSLAGELRRAGGYAKDDTPYSEFLWADFLRRRVSLHIVTDKFEKAVEKAVQLANERAAAYLPGWAGVDAD
jgi:hypothetical protein